MSEGAAADRVAAPSPMSRAAPCRRRALSGTVPESRPVAWVVPTGLR